MTLTTFNKSFYAGEDITLPFGITNVNGAAKNINSATFRWVLYNSNTGIVVPKVSPTGFVFGDKTLGQVAVTLSSANTLNLTPDQYRHELVMTLAGKYSVEVVGELNIKKNVAVT